MEFYPYREKWESLGLIACEIVRNICACKIFHLLTPDPWNSNVQGSLNLNRDSLLLTLIHNTLVGNYESKLSVIFVNKSSFFFKFKVLCCNIPASGTVTLYIRKWCYGFIHDKTTKRVKNCRAVSAPRLFFQCVYAPLLRHELIPECGASR